MLNGPSSFQKAMTRIVPAIFGCIGLTVLVFLWEDQPPLIFWLVGSLIALTFCVIGFGTAIFGPRALRGVGPVLPKRLKDRLTAPLVDDEGQAPRVGYDCPNCGSSLGRDADVSPSGDAKCVYCDRWFNIHQ